LLRPARLFPNFHSPATDALRRNFQRPAIMRNNHNAVFFPWLQPPLLIHPAIKPYTIRDPIEARRIQRPPILSVPDIKQFRPRAFYVPALAVVLSKRRKYHAAVIHSIKFERLARFNIDDDVPARSFKPAPVRLRPRDQRGTQKYDGRAIFHSLTMTWRFETASG
jgi:hypothetical protein